MNQNKENYMLNLYQLKTIGIGGFYILAEDPTEAQKRLSKILDKSDYGVFTDRDIVNIRLIATEMEIYENGAAHICNTFRSPIKQIILPKS